MIRILFFRKNPRKKNGHNNVKIYWVKTLCYYLIKSDEFFDRPLVSIIGSFMIYNLLSAVTEKLIWIGITDALLKNPESKRIIKDHFYIICRNDTTRQITIKRLVIML